MNAMTNLRIGSAWKGTRFPGARHIFYFPLAGEAWEVPEDTVDDSIRQVCRQAHSLRQNWHIVTARGLVSVHCFMPLRQRCDVGVDVAQQVVRAVLG